MKPSYHPWAPLSYKFGLRIKRREIFGWVLISLGLDLDYGEPEIRGVNTDAFNPSFGRGWLVAGGADKVLGDDGKPKELEGSLGPVRFSMRKGAGHMWTRFCEDSMLIYAKPNGVVTAVFDGVSGEGDGSGGLASRRAANTLLEYVDRILEREQPDEVLEEYREKCVSSIPLGATTALILVIKQDGECLLYNKGDSMCYTGGRLINTLDSVGNLLLKWLNDDKPFSRYTFKRQGEITLCSDGVLNSWDDSTEININSIQTEH